MSRNRKAAEEVVYKWYDKLDPSGRNTAMIKEVFAAMSDDDFAAYVEKCRNKKATLYMSCPNLEQERHMSTDNNKLVAAEMGINLFQNIVYVDPYTGEEYITPEKYLVCITRVRRQIQTRENKMAVPTDNNVIDESTGQVTGHSGKASISSPEMLVLVSYGLTNVAEEFMKVRGGDEAAMRFADQNIIETGGATLDRIAKLGTSAKSTNTLATYLRGMHFDTNFDSK